MPPLLHLPSRKGPSFSLSFGGTWLLVFPLLPSGDGVNPGVLSPLLRVLGLQGQPLGSRRGQETPETRRDPFLSREWAASRRGDPAWNWK